jgi:hypothetical protein
MACAAICTSLLAREIGWILLGKHSGGRWFSLNAGGPPSRNSEAARGDG